jgi:hypothetical protein
MRRILGAFAYPLRSETAAGLTVAVAVLALTACGPKAGNGAAGQGVRWVEFTDPNAHAFEAETPAGWTVQGGSLFVSASDVRGAVRALSKDGGVELFVGDTQVPVFVEPNQLFAMAHMHEGDTYSGLGGAAVIASYPTPDGFAGQWGAMRLGQSCANVRLVSAQALPQAAQKMDAAYASGGIMMSLEAGEARFTCTGADGKPRQGYVMSALQRDQTTGASYWKAQFLAGYVATPERAAEATRLLAVMAGSFHVDPQWAARNGQLQANLSQIAARAGAAEAQSISESFHYQQAEQDRTARNFDNTIRGVAVYQDPVEGERTLENYEHQWRMPDGSHMGTASSTPPVPGAQELPRAPGQP